MQDNNKIHWTHGALTLCFRCGAALRIIEVDRKEDGFDCPRCNGRRTVDSYHKGLLRMKKRMRGGT